jgi:phosphoglucomutase
MSSPEPLILERALRWTNEQFDENTRREVQALIDSGDNKALTDAFYCDLEFGTGGLRGIMGVGTNRVNRYTLGAATQGLSNYLNAQFPQGGLSVALAHDSRNNARAFASLVANVFSANGILVHFFEDLRPTPELSFAIRKLGCVGGVMLTASHNPKEYSGYKVYWSDGCQILPPHDKGIISAVQAISDIRDIRFEGRPELIKSLGAEMDRQFIDTSLTLRLRPEAPADASDLRIVYSPIHGTGMELVPRLLKEASYQNVFTVDAQCIPDGNFPTVVYPNPEEHEALTMALKLGEEQGAHLVLATDPDADRVGAAIRDPKGKFMLLNGNQTGVLLFEYLLEQWKAKGRLTGNEYVVKTIVTSYLIDRLAAEKGVECLNTLTGFKYIGAVMTEREGQKTYIAGCEESYGYLVGEHVRDKDAVGACLMIAEMAAYYHSRGQSLYEVLMGIYRKYGLFLETLISVTLKGKEGAEQIAELMKKFRSNPPTQLGGEAVVRVRDYQASIEKDLLTGNESPINLPKSNVLQLITESEGIISARPSGTEPKIKYYISLNHAFGPNESFVDAQKGMQRRFDQIERELRG